MAEGALDRGRDAFEKRAWIDAHAELTAADQDSPLGVEDLERLAVTARMMGRDQEGADAWTRAHRQSLDAGEIAQAVRYAFWLAFALVNSGEMAQAGGWLARAQRLLDEAALDCVERGYLMLIPAIGGGQSDPAGSVEAFESILEIADRFDDHSLAAMGRMGLGRSLIRLDRAVEGMPLLDEVMIAVTTEEAHPMVVGDLYCSVIEGCWEVFDVARAREWTAVLSDWCDAQSDLVPFKGQCLVHRAQILQLRGAWHDALAEAERACVIFSQPPGQPVAGLAFYQRAELCRLLGEHAQAEDDYRLAGEWGPSSYPGLAQLRVLQGRVDVAESAIKRCLAESTDRVTRARLLPAAAEILLAAGQPGLA